MMEYLRRLIGFPTFKKMPASVNQYSGRKVSESSRIFAGLFFVLCNVFKLESGGKVFICAKLLPERMIPPIVLPLIFSLRKNRSIAVYLPGSLRRWEEVYCNIIGAMLALSS